MSKLIDSIIETREAAVDVCIQSLGNIKNNSEIEIRAKLLSEIKKRDNLFPEGYYCPPPFGIAVLLDQKPFHRFKYDSLRNPDYWSNESSTFIDETVGMIYFSPVNSITNMIGDIGFTFYNGSEEKIKEHIKKSYSAILEVAEYAEVGMKFSDLCIFTKKLFYGKLKITKWSTISFDPNQNMNLGHTIPGSFENNLILGSTFEEVKENIRRNRIPLGDTENFEILDTCAFTVESRLEDFNDSNLPSVHFHFIVCFDKGRKTILDNYSGIFNLLDMSYMNSN